MFGKIEHLGIAVADLKKSAALFEALLGVAPYKEEEVQSEGVRTMFFKSGVNKIELLEAAHIDSPIAKFLEKRGEGLHHVAFDVEDILSEIDRLKKAGFRMIHEVPKDGADNKLIAFVHPSSTNGLLVELCQEKKS